MSLFQEIRTVIHQTQRHVFRPMRWQDADEQMRMVAQNLYIPQPSVLAFTYSAPVRNQCLRDVRIEEITPPPDREDQVQVVLEHDVIQLA
jgi:hypothetical protein